MAGLALSFIGADQPCGPDGPVHIDGGLVVDTPQVRTVDLSGFQLLPGIVDLHGDGFERQLAPRRGVLKDLGPGLRALDAELGANGITTAVLAQFWSWEGGMRGPAFARRLAVALEGTQDLLTDLRLQLRLETHLVDEFPEFLEFVDRFHIGFVVLNDHLPHSALAAGKRPPRLTGQALKSGRSPEAHLALLQALHARSPEVPAALDRLCAKLLDRGVLLGSHDDRTAQDRKTWDARGAAIAEFPETMDAARAARAFGAGIVLGAPNVVRGGSHSGNMAATDAIAASNCDALASDYHYPAPVQAARALDLPLGEAWKLVSAGPARLLGLQDRGRLDPGMRADLCVLDPGTGRVLATLCAGRFSHLAGPVAERLLAGA